jgi:hypothetical protein
LKAALVYAQRLGWRVLPIEPNGKRPRIADWVNAASNDPETVEQWVAEFPDSNVGIATGHDFFVLDVDPRNGGVAPEGLPDTVIAATPSGGAHYLFKPVAGLTNSAGKLGPGLDIRAAGGQIVVAPSRTPVGTYRWVKAPWSIQSLRRPPGCSNGSRLPRHPSRQPPRGAGSSRLPRRSCSRPPGTPWTPTGPLWRATAATCTRSGPPRSWSMTSP